MQTINISLGISLFLRGGRPLGGEVWGGGRATPDAHACMCVCVCAFCCFAQEAPAQKSPGLQAHKAQLSEHWTYGFTIWGVEAKPLLFCIFNVRS